MTTFCGSSDSDSLFPVFSRSGRGSTTSSLLILQSIGPSCGLNGIKSLFSNIRS